MVVTGALTDVAAALTGLPAAACVASRPMYWLYSVRLIPAGAGAAGTSPVATAAAGACAGTCADACPIMRTVARNANIRPQNATRNPPTRRTVLIRHSRKPTHRYPDRYPAVGEIRHP